jgi:arylsulfatase A-like enzyme/Tfp pilus assembly protein PilF
MKPQAFTKIIILLVLVIIGCCMAWLFHEQVAGPKEIRSILIVSIDTCRADFLSCYGYPLKTTPNIDAIADKGILFENTIAPVPFTLPSHVSMLTGTIPPYHGVLDNVEYKLGAEHITLAEILKQNGFSTAAFVSCLVLDSKLGLDQGFDTYEDDFEKPTDPLGWDQQTAGETTNSILTWLQEHREGKNFIFAHYYDPHFPYEPPAPFDSRFRDAPALDNVMTNKPSALLGRYAGEIAYADHCMGMIVDKLKELDLYDSTLLIITSDHGEMHGTHGENTHGYFIYQDNIKVPLVFKLPGKSKPRRIANTVGLVDIVPTICSALGIEPLANIQGKDLGPYFHGNDEPYPDRHLYTQSLEPTKYEANSLLGVINDKYKYIQTTRSELYDLQGDPAELNNLINEQSKRARIMQDKLQQILEESVLDDISKVQLDDETIQRLASLGYLSGNIDEDFEFDENKKDPKDLVEYHVLGSAIHVLIDKEKYDIAIENCQKMISLRPDLYKAYFELARISLHQENFSGAVPHLQKSIELKPDHMQSHRTLAVGYADQGNYDKAIEHYLKVVQIDPGQDEAYYRLALCFYEQGRFDDADKHMRVLFSNPKHVKIILRMAAKLFKLKQIKWVHDYYAGAMELKPDSIDILNSLAWTKAASDIEGVRDPAGAAELAEKACELTEYKTPEVLDTLAVAYAASGAFDKAVTTAQKAIGLAIDNDMKDMAKRIQGRLKLYKAQQVYIDEALIRNNVPAEK